MQQYTGFAVLYDVFMEDIPYGEWTDYIADLLRDYKIETGLLLELGCGTGNMTRRLCKRGYDMIGIDCSEEMLMVARERSLDKEDEKNILYLCQDMREFELYGTVAAVVSFCDSMNYITQEEDLLSVFRLVNNYLDPGGVFIFDMDTPYSYERILGDTTVAGNREEGSYIWENTYYEEDMVNEVTLTFFIPEAMDEKRNSDDTSKASGTHYQKHEEIHYRRAYDIDTIRKLLEEAGMEWVAVYDALSKKPPKKDSERVYYIAREKQQKDKLYL